MNKSVVYMRVQHFYAEDNLLELQRPFHRQRLRIWGSKAGEAPNCPTNKLDPPVPRLPIGM